MLGTPSLQQSKKYALVIAIFGLLVFVALVIGIFVSKPKDIKREKLILKLPYYSQNYSIVYSDDKNQIYVNVINPPYEENRREALYWIKSQGADPTTLNFFYTPSSKFKELNKR